MSLGVKLIVRMKLMINKVVVLEGDNGMKWTVRIRNSKGKFILKDGWIKVINELNIKKDTLIRFELIHPMTLKMQYFVNFIRGKSFFIMHLGLDISIMVTNYIYLS